MKRALISCLLVLALTGCRQPPQQQALLVGGATCLLDASQALAGAFRAGHPQANVICDGGGSTAALIAVKRGAIDIAAVSRDLTAEEDEGAMHAYLVARDALAIVVNPRNPVRNLEPPQLRAMMTGEVTNWNEIGGPSVPVELVICKSDLSPTAPLQESMPDNFSVSRAAERVDTPEQVRETVAHTPGALGYLPPAMVNSDVAAVALNGVPLSRATILSGRYPMSRSLYFAVYGTPTGVAREFLDFSLSDEGQKLLEERGLVRVN